MNKIEQELERVWVERDALVREKIRREMVISALSDKCVSLDCDLNTANWKIKQLQEQLTAPVVVGENKTE